jgi:mono/diheme cytochrome c family protein
MGIRLAVVLLLAPLAGAFAGEATLTFKRGGEVVAALTVAELEKKTPPETVSCEDPFYAKKKTFRCFPIAKLMEAVYGAGWQKGKETEAALAAMDGYTSQASAAKLAEAGGCLAFADAEVPGWELIGHKKVNPGPFYLFWAGPGQTTENAYPWPWQLASIDLIEFEKAYPEVPPRGAAAGSPPYKGYLLFRGRCMRCHSINQEGGKVGPDLNAPQSITAYRTKAWLKSWIKQPSKYRYSQMPDHLDLSDADLEDLYRYFKVKATQPEKKSF